MVLVLIQWNNRPAGYFIEMTGFGQNQSITAGRKGHKYRRLDSMRV